MEVVHEVLAYHTAEVHEQSLLFLTTEGSNAFAPFFEFLDALGVSQSHEHCKQVEKHVILIACLQGSCSFSPRAARNTCYTMCEVLLDSASCHKSLLYGIIGYALEVKSLRAAAYGFEQSAWIFAHKDEHCLRRRFFKQLEQFIGTRLVHAFGQPDYAHLISALTRLQTQLAR